MAADSWRMTRAQSQAVESDGLDLGYGVNILMLDPDDGELGIEIDGEMVARGIGPAGEQTPLLAGVIRALLAKR